jgi:protein SCO1/2
MQADLDPEPAARRPRPRHAVAVVVLALLLAACGSAPAAPSGIVRDPPPDVGEVSLPDASAGGAPFVIKPAPGRLLLVYFGFTSCPDVCPTTLADVRRALQDLEPELAARVELAMITVDPGRDDGERLTAYAHTFVPGAHALRTDDPAQLAAAAEAFGASYEVTTNEGGQVEVGHTAFLYAVDAAGHIRITWPFGIRHGDIENDLRYLFDQGV